MARSDDRIASNEALALEWLHGYEGSSAFSSLSAEAKKTLASAISTMSRCFTRRFNEISDTEHPINEMTSDDVIDVMTKQLPRTLITLAPDAVVEGLLEFLIWAAKANKLKNRDVEYACRRIRPDALNAMSDERRWCNEKTIVMRALRDGVDPADLAGIRAHAIASGLDARFVDEFAPFHVVVT